MARLPRIRLDDIPLHIVQRGHNRAPCFFSESDYLVYLHCLREAAIHNDCRLHAYVLMTNHVHLLMTPRRADAVPRIFVSIGRRYVQHINRRYKRTGTLWDRRYYCSLIDTDSYLLACHRYIELNPVRAGLVTDPSHYRWSNQPFEREIERATGRSLQRGRAGRPWHADWPPPDESSVVSTVASARTFRG